MLLKFIGENGTSGPVGNNCPFIVGAAYEVAEIFEHSDHLMVRNPGDEKWPVLGTPMFGWHPEFFERTSEPIPIVASGYGELDLSGSFGVLLDDPADVAKARDYDDLEYATVEMELLGDSESFDDWFARGGKAYPGRLARCRYDLERVPIGAPAVMIPEDVFFVSDDIRVPFATFSYSTQELVWLDVGNQEAQRHITSLLEALSIDARPARILDDVECWTKDEYPRLINAPEPTVVEPV